MSRLAAERLDLRARGCIPELERLVETRRDHIAAVRTVGDSVNRLRVSLERRCQPGRLGGLFCRPQETDLEDRGKPERGSSQADGHG